MILQYGFQPMLLTATAAATVILIVAYWPPDPLCAGSRPASLAAVNRRAGRGASGVQHESLAIAPDHDGRFVTPLQGFPSMDAGIPGRCPRLDCLTPSASRTGEPGAGTGSRHSPLSAAEYGGVRRVDREPLAGDVGRGAAGVEAEIRLPVGDRLAGQAEIRERFRLVEMDVRVVRVDVEGDLERDQGLLQLVELAVQAADLRPGFDVLVVVLDGDVVPLQGAADVVEPVQALGQVKMGLRSVGAAHELHPERLDRFGDAAVVIQAAAGHEPVADAVRLGRLAMRLELDRRGFRPGDRPPDPLASEFRKSKTRWPRTGSTSPKRSRTTMRAFWARIWSCSRGRWSPVRRRGAAGGPFRGPCG